MNQNITFQEYKNFYLDFVDRLLGIREQEFDAMQLTGDEKKQYFNQAEVTKVVLMVAFIESNFLTRAQMKSLRNFNHVEELPNSVNQEVLSCFIYIRDAMAHSPNGQLLPKNQINTKQFIEAISENRFPHAIIDGSTYFLQPQAIHSLHLLIRNLYGK